MREENKPDKPANYNIDNENDESSGFFYMQVLSGSAIDKELMVTEKSTGNK